MVHRSIGIVAAAGCVAALSACGGNHSGRQILDELERDRIPLPDEPPPEPAQVAELPADGPITLAMLLAVAEARSPQLAAARSDVGIAAGQRWQAALYPNPRIDVGTEDISLSGDGASDSKTTVGLTQPIVLGDRRRAAADSAGAEQAARLADVEVQRRALFSEVAGLHSGIVTLREQMRLYGELRELAGKTVSTAQARFEARAAPETDVIRPRVEVYRIDATLRRLTQEQAAAVQRLQLLLGGAAIDAARLAGTIDPSPAALDLAALQSTVRRSHPSLAAADRQVDAAEARLDQVKAERTPDLDIRVAGGYRNEEDDAIVELGAGMTVPIWDVREGDVLSARFALMKARQQRTVMENDLLARLSAAVGEYEAARGQLETFRDQIVPDARRAFGQTDEAYRTGHASFLDLLDAQRTMTESSATVAELSGAVAAARATLVQFVGVEGLHVPAPAAPAPSPPVRPEGAEVKP